MAFQSEERKIGSQGKKLFTHTHLSPGHIPMRKEGRIIEEDAFYLPFSLPCRPEKGGEHQGRRIPPPFLLVGEEGIDRGNSSQLSFSWPHSADILSGHQPDPDNSS